MDRVRARTGVRQAANTTRYYFDIDDGERVTHDMEGQELPSLQVARNEAIAVLPEIANDELPDGDQRTFTSSVRSETGAIILRVTLSLRVEWLTATEDAP